MGEWIVGCDVGGTFTDFCARRLGTGSAVLHKRPSTPADPAQAVLLGLQEMLSLHGIEPESVGRFAHGTTVATNALLQRKGAKIAMVTTKGFRDLVEIGRQVRPLIYDLQTDASAPLADRYLRFEVSERTNSAGSVELELTQEEIDRVVNEIGRHPEINSVAICLLFSFLNSTHEDRLAAAIRRSYPNLFVSTSYEVQPEFREYERFSTTLVNAFLQPEVSKYMDRLRAEVNGIAPNAEFGIFQSSGGLMSVMRASQLPVRTALSGPAAGAVGAAASGARSSIRNVITLDIGGTSSDVCLIRDGRTALAAARDISGFRIRLPMVEIHTVGAGGGSIARLGADRLMKVGPESAGAIPGPACYGHGGKLPTVSDANVVLGRLPTDLAGGGLKIDRGLAIEALQPLVIELGISVEKVALGIIGIVNSNMVRAIRAVSVEKGHDPRKFMLMPFGGAGGLHAAEVARALGMKRIVIPISPGILCAEGLIVADLQEDFVVNCLTRLGGPMNKLALALDGLVREAREWLDYQASGTDSQMVVSLDMRYVGQNYELQVEVARSYDTVELPDVEALKTAFFADYSRSYGHHDEQAPIEIVSVRLRVTKKLLQASADIADPRGPAKPSGAVDVWLTEEGPVETPVYQRETLPRGTVVEGPAIISQFDSTTFVPSWASAVVDDSCNLLMELSYD
ncbi:hydantoinase/oxoprolinase family protein [Mesorhizobium sp.]|uniref:hydantoinase/oxoprolinase family protein n=1 Tax=Mesorhizobium sp. TaxID=1871066 RepID=UPI000FE8C58E|nr:hydantoinase/oxoprolinase family protein [Mesorhizobium sp.]RWB66297.1 MAG: hydantoinase/oxoprolinase family protein [Mesorhizobium sp.]